MKTSTKNLLAGIAALTAISTVAHAQSTTLTQIPTPVTQAQGTAEIGEDYANAAGGHQGAVLANIGVAHGVQIGIIRAVDPGDKTTANAKIELRSNGAFKFGLGLDGIGATNRAQSSYAVGGVYVAKLSVIGGVTRYNNHSYQGFGGVAYAATKAITLQADYRAGAGNYSSLGVNVQYGRLSVNPAILRANDGKNATYGYVGLRFAL